MILLVLHIFQIIWTLLIFGVLLRFLSRIHDFSFLEGSRWSKIAPGRFLASQVSSEPKFSSNCFSRPSNRRSNVFQKGKLVDFSKTSDMLRFLEKYCKLPLGFHFFGGHFPLGRRIFSRSLFLSINCIMKIIRIGGTPRKRDYFFSIKLWRHAHFENFMTSCDR